MEFSARRWRSWMPPRRAWSPSLVVRKDITGKQAEVVRLLSPPGLQTGELLVVGLGDRSSFGQAQAVHAAGAAAKQLAARQRQQRGLLL